MAARTLKAVVGAAAAMAPTAVAVFSFTGVILPRSERTTHPPVEVSGASAPSTGPIPIYSGPPYGISRKVPVSDDDIQAELQRLRAENELLKKSGRSKLAMKVSEKGALSVYGMGRFPVTLYKEQWIKLLDMGDEIRAFIEANNDALKAKE